MTNTNSTDTTLRPCPFCGDDLTILNSLTDGKRSIETNIYCSTCFINYDPDGFIKLDVWNNAYCWREIDRLNAIIQEKDDLKQRLF